MRNSSLVRELFARISKKTSFCKGRLILFLLENTVEASEMERVCNSEMEKNTVGMAEIPCHNIRSFCFSTADSRWPQSVR